MQWSTNDMAVIVEALKQAMANEADYQAIQAYQEVLNKIQGHSNPAGNLAANVGTTGTASADGFRYDYDDASDVY